MARAKGFPRAQHRRQRLADAIGRIKKLGGAVTQIAVPARFRRLAKIREQHLPTAGRRLGQTQQGVQPRVIGLLAVQRRRAFINLRAAQADVIGAIECERFRRGAITARAADFLIIGFDGFREIGMGDPADIRLVDAHSEGDGRADDQPVFLLKPHLDAAAILGFHPAVIMAGRMARLAQRLGQHLGLGAGAAIDNARLPLSRARKIKDLAARIVLYGKGQMDVRPIKPTQEGGGFHTPEKPGHDFGAGFFIRRGRKGRKRHAEALLQFANTKVIRAEVMAPLADAMRLIHGDQPGADPPQQAHRPGRGEPFGRHVEQLEPPLIQRLKHGLGFFVGIARGQRPGLDPGFTQAADLIAHQRNQRRDDHRHPVAAKSRQLKAKGFPATRRHDGQGVAPLQHGFDDFFLTGTEGPIAEDRRQKLARVVHGSVEHRGVVDDHDPQRVDRQQRHQRRQINAAQIGQDAADAVIDRGEQAVQTIPDLRHQRLPQVQDLKVDQPAHDDMGQDDELRDAEKHQQDLQDRNHGTLAICCGLGSAQTPKAQQVPQRFA